MKKRLKIAVIGSRSLPANYGGVETACENLYVRLAQKGLGISAYCRSERFIVEQINYKGVHVFNFPVPNIPGFSTFLHCFMASLLATFSDADIIHFHAQGPALFSVIPKILSPKKKIGFTCHGRDWERERWGKIARKIIKLGEVVSARLTDFRIMVSEDLQQYYQLIYGVSSTKLCNGVIIPEKVALSTLAKRFDLKKEQYLLFVGRLVPEKAPDILIQAFNKITTNIKLVIAGDSPETPGYINYLKSLAAGNENIVFTSYIRGREIAEAYSNALAYVSSSKLEGNPITALEAMSYSLPILVSDIPPHQEILSYYPNDCVASFKTNSIDDCQKALLNLITMSKQRLKQMGNDSKQVVQQHFDWDMITDMTETVYKNVMNVSHSIQLETALSIETKELAGTKA